MRPFEQQVKNGIALLNKHEPGWVARIDTSKLNVHDFFQCVLGQVFGRYALGVVQLDLRQPGEAVSYGFGCNRADYNDLHNEWLLQLKETT